MLSLEHKLQINLCAMVQTLPIPLSGLQQLLKMMVKLVKLCNLLTMFVTMCLCVYILRRNCNYVIS